MAGIIEDKQSVDKLSSKNYSTWKFKLKHLLIAKELWGYVDGSIIEPEESASVQTKLDYTKKSSKAMSIIVLSVSDDLLYLITSCAEPKQAWGTLQQHFERDTLMNRLFLKK